MTAKNQVLSYKNPSKQAQKGSFLKKSKKTREESKIDGNNKLKESESNTSSASSSGYMSHMNYKISNEDREEEEEEEVEQQLQQVPNRNRFLVGSQLQLQQYPQYHHHTAQNRKLRLGNATRPPMVPMVIDDDDDDDDAGNDDALADDDAINLDDNQFIGRHLIDDEGGLDGEFYHQLRRASSQVYAFEDTGDHGDLQHQHQRVEFHPCDDSLRHNYIDNNISFSSQQQQFNQNGSNCLDNSNSSSFQYQQQHQQQHQQRLINHPFYFNTSNQNQIAIQRYKNHLTSPQNLNQFLPSQHQIQNQYHQHSLNYQQQEFQQDNQQQQQHYSLNYKHLQSNGNNQQNSFYSNRNYIVHPTLSQRLINEQEVASKRAHIKMESGSSRQHLTASHGHHHSSNTNHLKRSPRKQTGKFQTSDKEATKEPLGFCAKMAKMLLLLANILLWIAGLALGAWGILSLVEDHKYNLSQLLVFEANSRMSLFQLLAWSFITLGCATILIGFCGCSAILKNSRWILGLYIFLILAIFALDLATGLLAIIFQERLVANVRLRLTNKLKTEYGIQASFTAAIDYIQTKYECCGLEGHFDYDQSVWRLQRLGGFEATVARTCCHLRNNFDDQAHINPRPVNESMCQSTDVRFHQSYRYRKGCLDDLERLIRFKIWNFTIGCAAVGAIILLSLFFATCFCRSIPKASGNSSRKSSVSANLVDTGHHRNHRTRQKQQQQQASNSSIMLTS